jgi:hypothetical protein
MAQMPGVETPSHFSMGIDFSVTVANDFRRAMFDVLYE